MGRHVRTLLCPMSILFSYFYMHPLLPSFFPILPYPSSLNLFCPPRKREKSRKQKSCIFQVCSLWEGPNPENCPRCTSSGTSRRCRALPCHHVRRHRFFGGDRPLSTPY